MPTVAILISVKGSIQFQPALQLRKIRRTVKRAADVPTRTLTSLKSDTIALKIFMHNMGGAVTVYQCLRFFSHFSRLHSNLFKVLGAALPYSYPTKS